jgi:hypothetical protein
MKKILIVCNQHGNELLGDRLRASLEEKNSEALKVLTFLNANPEAKRLGVRFVDSDMNRAYRPKTVKLNYEEKKAREIIELTKKFDLVLDMHTTTCMQPESVIVSSLNLENSEANLFLSSLNINQIVEMNEPIARDSLIGNVPHSLCFELNNKQINKCLNLIEEGILNYCFGKSKYPQKELYQIDGIIEKNKENLRKKFTNLKRHGDGFYPFLTGSNNSYRTNPAYKYLGFKAKNKLRIKV